MTLEEATAIGMIAGTADGGCSVCVRNLIDRLNAAFPAFQWEMTRDEQEEQPEWSDDPKDIMTVGYVVACKPATVAG